MIDPRSLPIPPKWEAPIALYIARCKTVGKRPETLRTYEERLAALARGVKSGPYEMTSEDVELYFSEQCWSPSTRRARLQTWRGFWRWAIAKGYTDIDPTKDLPPIKLPPPEPKPLPYRLYLEALFRAKTRTRIILRLAGELGLRRGEIALVNTASDLVETHRGWTLIVRGKGGKARRVPVPVELSLLLRAEPLGLLLPGRIDGHLSPRRVSELAREVLPGEWTIHKLRHMFASRTYAVSRDLAAVQELLGHASPMTTKNYVAVDDEQLRSIVEAVSTKSFKHDVNERIRRAEGQTVTFDVATVSVERATELIGILAMRVNTLSSKPEDPRWLNS